MEGGRGVGGGWAEKLVNGGGKMDGGAIGDGWRGVLENAAAADGGGWDR